MASLQNKLTGTLLVTGIMTALTVGGIAHWMLLRDFRATLMAESFERFRGDVVAYLNTHGSWAQAVRQEDFTQFIMRRHPPPPPGARPRRTGIDRGGAPPFRFLLSAPDGRVLLGTDTLPAGVTLPPAMLANALPITIAGRTVALASPQGEPALTHRDRDYLDATRKALLTGVLVAFLLALGLGILTGRSLSTSLRALTRAIRGMQENKELPVQVPVRSRDEIGALAAAFNSMNQELTRTHRGLREYAELVEKQAAALKELSIRDPLTGLFNRRHFDEQANTLYQHAVRYGHPMTVVVADLDHFKRINDAFSHAIGDAVLREVSRLLRDGVRKADLVARHGGEEFIILFPESNLAQASQCCEKLRESIEQFPWKTLDAGLRVTISMGLSDAVWLGDMDPMVADADRHLYMAKHHGRNCLWPPSNSDDATFCPLPPCTPPLPT